MSDFQGQLIEVAHDLLAIEVNTIVKPNMTATRMRNVAHTLLDIIGEYDEELLKEETSNPNPDKSFDTTKGVALVDAIKQLSKRARTILAHKDAQPSPDKPAAESDSRRYVITRIRDNCDTILGLFDALAAREGSAAAGSQPVTRMNATIVDIPLTTSERLQLRKIWEVGTETVMMQTVIHLNGDVFTRMNRQIAEGSPNSAIILDIHSQGVQKAVKFWNKLSKVVVGMFTALVTKLKT